MPGIARVMNDVIVTVVMGFALDRLTENSNFMKLRLIKSNT
jgi:hypothetical protein